MHEIFVEMAGVAFPAFFLWGESGGPEDGSGNWTGGSGEVEGWAALFWFGRCGGSAPFFSSGAGALLVAGLGIFDACSARFSPC